MDYKKKYLKYKLKYLNIRKLYGGSKNPTKKFKREEVVTHPMSVIRNIRNGIKPNKNDVNFTDKDDVTPLHIAASWDNEELIQILLNNEAKIDLIDKKGYTALHKSVFLNNLKAIGMLLEKDADTNIKNESGDTPLMTAVKRNDITISGWLLQHGADPNIINNNGDIPLIVAIKGENSLEFVKLLLDNRADPNLQGWRRSLPLDEAVIKMDYDLIELLLEKGANPNPNLQTSNIENTPLINAILASTGQDGEYSVEKLNNQLDIIELLLDSGAEQVSSNTISGLTPLMHVVLNDDILHDHKKKIIELLFYKDSRIDKVDNYGETVFMMLASEMMLVSDYFDLKNKKELIKILLEKGTNINHKNSDGNTVFMKLIIRFRFPLYYYRTNIIDFLNFLCEQDPKPNFLIRNRSGETALDIAIKIIIGIRSMDELDDLDNELIEIIRRESGLLNPVKSTRNKRIFAPDPELKL